MIDTKKYSKSFDKLNISAMQLYDLSNYLIVQCFDFIDKLEANESDPLEAFKQSFYRNDLIFDIKQFAILIRDIHFRRFKTNQLLKDDLIKEDQANIQLEGIRAIFTKAEAALDQKMDYIKSLKTINRKLADQWFHHHSSIGEIRIQMEEIQRQLGLIRDADSCLNKVREDLDAFRQWVKNVFNNFRQSLDLVKLRDDNIISEIDVLGAVSKSELKEFIQLHRRYYAELEIEKNKYPIQEYSVETEEQGKIPVNLNNTLLVYKEVPFSMQITRWEESEVYPSVLAVQERIIQIYERSLSGLFNMLNRLQLLTGEEANISDFEAETLRNYLDKIHDNIEESEVVLRDTAKTLNDKIDKELPVSNVFSSDRIYLNLPSGLSLSRYSNRRWLWIDREKIISQWKRSKTFLLEFLHLSKMYEDQSNLSEVVRFIDHMCHTDMDRLSQSLFFGKGYMGKTFMMERENYVKLLADTVHKWKDGYRGSLLIYGKRLSGRSTLAEFTGFSNLFNGIVFLHPNKDTQYNGRIIQATYNLGEILQQLDYYAVSDQLGVVIDDIELWRDKQFSWYRNIQSLINAMSKSGRRIFFIVGCGHMAKIQLDEYIDFSNQFISMYCSDRMKREEILNAILIRYGASQTSDEELSTAEITKRAVQIIQQNEQNVGVCLMEWYRLFYMDEQKKELEGKISIGAFKNLVKKYAYFLRHMLKLKITSELELRESVGSESFKHLSQDIQLLLGLKVLERMKSTRQLRINEFIVDEIELILLNE